MTKSKTKNWDFKFLNRFERQRALEDGYAIIILRPGTAKEEKALVEFESDGKTPIHKRHPLRYYDTCLSYNVLPSEAHLYYINTENSQNAIERIKEANIIASVEKFRDLFENVIINETNSKHTSQFVISFGGYTLEDSILNEVEKYLLGFDIEDVEVEKDKVTIKLKNERK